MRLSLSVLLVVVACVAQTTTAQRPTRPFPFPNGSHTRPTRPNQLPTRPHQPPTKPALCRNWDVQDQVSCNQTCTTKFGPNARAHWGPSRILGQYNGCCCGNATAHDCCEDCSSTPNHVPTVQPCNSQMFNSRFCNLTRAFENPVFRYNLVNAIVNQSICELNPAPSAGDCGALEDFFQLLVPTPCCVEWSSCTQPTSPYKTLFDKILYENMAKFIPQLQPQYVNFLLEQIPLINCSPTNCSPTRR